MQSIHQNNDSLLKSLDFARHPDFVRSLRVLLAQYSSLADEIFESDRLRQALLSYLDSHRQFLPDHSS
jgi:hypothetical protein